MERMKHVSDRSPKSSPLGTLARARESSSAMVCGMSVFRMRNGLTIETSVVELLAADHAGTQTAPTGFSEQDLQRELHLPGGITGRVNRAKVRSIEDAVRPSENWGIGQVKRLRSKFNR